MVVIQQTNNADISASHFSPVPTSKIKSIIEILPRTLSNLLTDTSEPFIFCVLSSSFEDRTTADTCSTCGGKRCSRDHRSSSIGRDCARIPSYSVDQQLVVTWRRSQAWWSVASWTRPDLAEPGRASDNFHFGSARHIASRADPNWKQCSWHFWSARMSNQVHVFSLMDSIWWRSLLFTRNRRIWMHNISSRHESFGEFHDLLDDLLKDEKFWRYFRMSSDTFKYILELIHISIKKQNTNFRRSISPEERLIVTLRWDNNCRKGPYLHNIFIIMFNVIIRNNLLHEVRYYYKYMLIC
jgi:hypothetical protein